MRRIRSVQPLMGGGLIGKDLHSVPKGGELMLMAPMGKDDVPVILQKGELVVNKASVPKVLDLIRKHDVKIPGLELQESYYGDVIPFKRGGIVRQRQRQKQKQTQKVVINIGQLSKKRASRPRKAAAPAKTTQMTWPSFFNIAPPVSYSKPQEAPMKPAVAAGLPAAVATAAAPPVGIPVAVGMAIPQEQEPKLPIPSPVDSGVEMEADTPIALKPKPIPEGPAAAMRTRKVFEEDFEPNPYRSDLEESWTYRDADVTVPPPGRETTLREIRPRMIVGEDIESEAEPMPSMPRASPERNPRPTAPTPPMEAIAEGFVEPVEEAPKPAEAKEAPKPVSAPASDNEPPLAKKFDYKTATKGAIQKKIYEEREALGLKGIVPSWLNYVGVNVLKLFYKRPFEVDTTSAAAFKKSMVEGAEIALAAHEERKAARRKKKAEKEAAE